MNRPLAIGILAAIALTAALAAALWYVPEQRAPAAVSILAAAPASLITAVLIYLLQRPDFATGGPPFVSFGHRPGEPVQAVTGAWIHIPIRNTSRGLLGGGVAAGVSAEISFLGGGTFATKWQEKDNPLTVYQSLVQTPSGVLTQNVLGADPFRVPGVREITIGPAESKNLDIAVAWVGDRALYVWDPLVFLSLNFKDPKVRLDPSRTHTFELKVVWYGTRRTLGTFDLSLDTSSTPARPKITPHKPNSSS